MSTHNIQFHDKIKKKKNPNIYFLERSVEFRRESKTDFESSQVNEPSVFVIEDLLYLEINFTVVVNVLSKYSD